MYAVLSRMRVEDLLDVGWLESFMFDVTAMGGEDRTEVLSVWVS